MKISVIVPFHNEEDYIARCIESLLEQSVLADEIILVDNNSTDKSRKIAKTYKGVKVVDASKQGPGFARDVGFAAASGDILARIDADTRVGGDWIERLRHAFTDDTVDAVSGSAWFYDVPLGKFWEVILRLYFFEFNALVCGVRPMFGSNMALRRELYDEVKDELTHENNIWEDLEMSLLLRHRRIVTIKLPAAVSMRSAYVRASNMFLYMGRWTRTFETHGYRRGVIGARIGLLSILAWWPLVYLLTRRKANLQQTG